MFEQYCPCRIYNFLSEPIVYRRFLLCRRLELKQPRTSAGESDSGILHSCGDIKEKLGVQEMRRGRNPIYHLTFSKYLMKKKKRWWEYPTSEVRKIAFLTLCGGLLLSQHVDNTPLNRLLSCTKYKYERKSMFKNKWFLFPYQPHIQAYL